MGKRLVVLSLEPFDHAPDKLREGTFFDSIGTPITVFFEGAYEEYEV
jgi:hypothetical protein